MPKKPVSKESKRLLAKGKNTRIKKKARKWGTPSPMDRARGIDEPLGGSTKSTRTKAKLTDNTKKKIGNATTAEAKRQAKAGRKQAAKSVLRLQNMQGSKVVKRKKKKKK